MLDGLSGGADIPSNLFQMLHNIFQKNMVCTLYYMTTVYVYMYVSVELHYSMRKTSVSCIIRDVSRVRFLP